MPKDAMPTTSSPHDPTAARMKLKAALDRSEFTASSLAEAIGRDPNYVRDFLNGRKKSIKPVDLAAIEDKLALPPGSLVTGRTYSDFSPLERDLFRSMPQEIREKYGFPTPPPDDADIPAIADGSERNFRPAPQFLGKRDLPVYSAVEGGPGEMVVQSDPIDFVPRPWFLQSVKEGYAVLVTGESMSPAYDPGDMVLVNPRLPYVRNKNHIFVANETEGDYTATVKRLVSMDADTWVVSQYNPPKEFELPRAKWARAFRVVGKYEGS